MKLRSVEMRFFRGVKGCALRDLIRNGGICKNLNICDPSEKI